MIIKITTRKVPAASCGVLVNKMQQHTTQNRRLLKVISKPWAQDILVTKLRGQESLSTLFEYELTMVIANSATTAKNLLGKPFCIALCDGDGIIKRYIHGIIRACAYLFVTIDEHKVYRIQLVPTLWWLTRSYHCRDFMQQSTLNIVKQLFAAVQYEHYDIGKLRHRYTKRSYCVQYQESDWHFILRLLAAEGIFFYFRHHYNQHQLIFADHNDCFNNVNINNDRWYWHQRRQSVKQHCHRWAEVNSTDLRMSIGMACNGLLIEHLQLKANDPPMRAIAYGVQAYSNQLRCLPMNVTYKPPSTAHVPKMKGPQTAIVTGPKGQEVHVNHLGKVTIRLHWAAEQEAHPTQWHWVPVSQHWAGTLGGMQWIPRVGQEVLVDFIEDNPDQPIIIGCLYNGANQASQQNILKTRRLDVKEVIGHAIYCERRGNRNYWVWQAAQDSHYNIMGDANITIGAGRHVVVKGGARVTLAQGKYSVQAQKSICLQAGDSQILITKQGVVIKAQRVTFNS